MATIRENVVILKGSDIQEVEYVPGSAVVTKGQPFQPGVDIRVGRGAATILFRSGRKKSAPVAKAFAKAAQQMYAPYAGGGGAPKELNFMFALRVRLGDALPIVIYLGQGSTLLSRNNWWIGTPELRDRRLRSWVISGTSPEEDTGLPFKEFTKIIPEPYKALAGMVGGAALKELFGAVNVFNFVKVST